MRNIVSMTRLSNTRARKEGMSGTDEIMLQFSEGRTQETFYATYEPISSPCLCRKARLLPEEKISGQIG